MNRLRTTALLVAAASLQLLAGTDSSQVFHFWFQREGGCVACAEMPPPGDAGTFSEKAGISVMFNGYNQATGGHWRNLQVQSYAVTYTYAFAGIIHSAKQTAPGNAASIVIKPYAASDLNKAQVVSITVAATYASGTVTKTIHSPVAFKLY